MNARPIIHVYTVVRDEEYHLPYFLAHYTSFASRIFIIDDGSTDRTRAIAGAFTPVSSSCTITLLDYPYRSGLNESHIACHYEDLSATYSRGTADWMMFPDVDEHIQFAPSSRQAALHDILSAANILHCPVVACRGVFMALPSSDLTPADPTSVRTGYFEPRYDKPIIINTTVHFTIGPGRHTVKTSGPTFTQGPLLFHYCYLGANYIRARIARNFSRMLHLTDEARESERKYRTDKAIRSYRRACKNLKTF